MISLSKYRTTIVELVKLSSSSSSTSNCQTRFLCFIGLAVIITQETRKPPLFSLSLSFGKESSWANYRKSLAWRAVNQPTKRIWLNRWSPHTHTQLERTSEAWMMINWFAENKPWLSYCFAQLCPHSCSNPSWRDIFPSPYAIVYRQFENFHSIDIHLIVSEMCVCLNAGRERRGS